MRSLLTLIMTGMLLAAPARAETPNPRLKPPAPPPSAYIDKSDFDTLNDLAEAVRDDRFRNARALLDLEDPTALALAQWIYLDGNDPRLNFSVAESFFGRDLNWPSEGRLQRNAERAIPDDAAPERVVAFFADRAPLTGAGKLALARALLATGADADAAAAQVRSAWVHHDWRETQERDILSEFGPLLDAEDHVARVDFLLWGNRRTAARRMLNAIPSVERRAARVRMDLMARRRDAENAFNALPAEIRARPAMIYEAARYMRRRGDDDDGRALLLRLTDAPELASAKTAVWSERQLVARRALKSGSYEDAYRIAAGHGFDDGAPFAEGEWLAGWIALRFLDDPDVASGHFQRLREGVTRPISRARAEYWMGRASEDKDELTSARASYAAAAEESFTYYGQLASDKIALAPGLLAPLRAREPSAETVLRFEARATVRAIRLLGELEEKRLLRRFSFHLDDQLTAPDDFVLLARLTQEYGVADASIRASKTALANNILLPDLAYPLIDVPADLSVYAEPALVLGLSRQESEFNAQARSSAGAYGLMQLIPSTAKITANKIGERYQYSWLTADPGYNLTLGSAHLSHLLERFDDSYIMTLAAYNAGARRPERWIQDYGDPRTGQTDPIDWVELIPFSETRNYVQRVLENVQVYRGRIDGGPGSVTLVADLTRGSTTPLPASFARLDLDAALAASALEASLDGAGAPPRQEKAAEPPAPAVSPEPMSEPEISTPLDPTPQAAPSPTPTAPSAPPTTPAPAPQQTAPPPKVDGPAPESAIFEGAQTTDECELFIPDATGGGTCISGETPAAPAETDEAPEDTLCETPREDLLDKAVLEALLSGAPPPYSAAPCVPSGPGDAPETP